MASQTGGRNSHYGDKLISFWHEKWKRREGRKKNVRSHRNKCCILCLFFIFVCLLFFFLIPVRNENDVKAHKKRKYMKMSSSYRLLFLFFFLLLLFRLYCGFSAMNSHGIYDMCMSLNSYKVNWDAYISHFIFFCLSSMSAIRLVWVLVFLSVLFFIFFYVFGVFEALVFALHIRRWCMAICCHLAYASHTHFVCFHFKKIISFFQFKWLQTIEPAHTLRIHTEFDGRRREFVGFFLWIEQ